jgi:hypothetical protein
MFSGTSSGAELVEGACTAGVSTGGDSSSGVAGRGFGKWLLSDEHPANPKQTTRRAANNNQGRMSLEIVNVLRKSQ